MNDLLRMAQQLIEAREKRTSWLRERWKGGTVNIPECRLYIEK